MGQQKKVIIGEIVEGEEKKAIKQDVKKDKDQPQKKKTAKPVKKAQKTEIKSREPKEGKPRVRSQRYKKLSAKVSLPRYSLSEAIKKIQELATAGFDETIELHIKLKLKKGDKSLRALGADKLGNIHLKIGKASSKEGIIEKSAQEVLDKIPSAKIEKAILCSTMSPSLKLDV